METSIIKYNEYMIDNAIKYAFESVSIPKEEVGDSVYRELITDKVMESLYIQAEERLKV